MVVFYFILLTTVFAVKYTADDGYLKTQRYILASDRESCLGKEGCIYLKKFMIPDINDGLTFEFTDSKPEHLRYKVRTSSNSKEAGDVRLRKKDKSDSDVLFSGFNMNGYIKVNSEQKTYEYDAYEWIQVDHLLDYGDDEVEMYINGELETTTPFYYEDTGSVNQLILYNLNVDVEVWFKDLELCDERCPGVELDGGIILGIFSLLLILSF